MTVKDVVLARTPHDPARPAWSIPPEAYAKLMDLCHHPRLNRKVEFPILGSMTAHAEGLSGDFFIAHEQIPSFLREINTLLDDSDTAEFDDVRETPALFRELAMEASRSGQSIYGYAD